MRWIRGRFEIVLAGESVMLERGYYLAVPKHTRHSARVISDEAIVGIDAVKSGR